MSALTMVLKVTKDRDLEVSNFAGVGALVFDCLQASEVKEEWFALMSFETNFKGVRWCHSHNDVKVKGELRQVQWLLCKPFAPATMR